VTFRVHLAKQLFDWPDDIRSITCFGLIHEALDYLRQADESGRATFIASDADWKHADYIDMVFCGFVFRFFVGSGLKPYLVQRIARVDVDDNDAEILVDIRVHESASDPNWGAW